MTTEKQTPEALAAECKRLREALCAVYFRQGQQFNHSSMSEAVQLIRQHDSAIDRLAALAAAQQVEPPGWKLVPVEPTLEMVAALATDKFPDDWEAGKSLQRKQMSLPEDQCIPFNHEVECAVGKYQRLLTAAPPAPAAEKRQGLTEQEIDDAIREGGIVHCDGPSMAFRAGIEFAEDFHGIPPADAKEGE